MPITVHPFETMTNYAVACSLRCNYDNQSLLYLPPGSVLKLPLVPNIGPRPEYAHMERTEDDLSPKWLLDIEEEPLEDGQDDELVGYCERLWGELESECSSAFQDAHNTGYYINEYTTKVNSLGDKLLQGLRRASDKVMKTEANKGPIDPDDKISAKRRA